MRIAICRRGIVGRTLGNALRPRGMHRDVAFVMARRDAANPKAESSVKMAHPHPLQVE
jgi:hypothetical protein